MRPQVGAIFANDHSRRVVLPLALLAVVVGLQSASATEIGLDSIQVDNSSGLVGDDFNDGVFDMPPWYILSSGLPGTTPGPEAGGTLRMIGGDSIYRMLETNPNLSVSAYSLMQLTSFPVGSFAEMILYGDQPGEFLSLGVKPGSAILTDGTGATLASVVLPASTSAFLQLTVIPLAPLTASVNGFPLAISPMADFGTITGFGIRVVPEPATLGLLGLGCVIMGVRRRLRGARD